MSEALELPTAQSAIQERLNALCQASTTDMNTEEKLMHLGGIQQLARMIVAK